MRAFLFVSKIILLYAAALSCTSAEGQSSSLALKNLQRQKWQRAYELLTKATAKDSLNVTAKYVLAQYFFSEGNTVFHLDSAYRHVLDALDDFNQTSEKEREKLLRFPVDSSLLSQLKEKIETIAFSEAHKKQSEESWKDFIALFPTSAYIPKAVELRDSLAFENAQSENTYIAFHDFLKNYPEAAQFKRAEANYEKLLLAAKTADNTIESFELFLIEYPNSAHRSYVEQTIFEYRTASGEPQDLLDFIKSYPGNIFSGKAKNILFHIIPESERHYKWPSEFTTDSLAEVMALDTTYLVPFLKNKKYGFMDSEGKEVIPSGLDSLRASYYCGNIHEDLILLPEKVVTKNGSCIWDGSIERFDDIGFGFLLFENKSCKSLMHKSGFRVGDDCIDDAKILSGRFAATKKGSQWSVYTLSGRLLAHDLDDVFYIKDVLCFKRQGQFKVLQASSLARLPSRLADDVVEYDEARSWDNNLIYVRKNDLSGLLDQSLNTVVPLGEGNLSQAFFGVISATPAGFRFYTPVPDSTCYKNFIAREPWLAVKDSLWVLKDVKTLRNLTTPFDTIIFSGSFPVGQRNDSSFIFFNSSNLWKGVHPSSIEFVPGKDLPYLLIELSGRKTLYNHDGKKLFTGTFDKIQYAGEGLFIALRNDKRGLYDTLGKLLIPFLYDGIGVVSDGTLSLLKSSKFGLYSHASKRQIPPSYSKNLISYNETILVASRQGQYGFIDWKNTPLSKFEFKEVRYWNDTTALVKKDYWMLYEIKTGAVLLDKIKDFSMIRDEPKEKLSIIYQDTSHGVLHNNNGVIIPISYSDIINVGSQEKPLYFTEKYVQEASVYMVIYYDAQGHPLRKEIYDQDDYERIYCHDD